MGKVYLVGAGPGDPGLITVRGLRYLSQADVVVYDRLVNQRLLEHARRDAELVFVGKGRGQWAATQEEIDRLLVERAQQGKTVVRLKGGDPFVFGRGGEEAQALAQAGVPFEVVPGVTSAVAALAYAGIPVTHRDATSSLTVVSGSEDPTKAESAVRWDLLAQIGGTLVVLMGWETLPGIVEELLQHGMAPSTPAALVQWGTSPRQRTVVGTLDTIVEAGQKAGLAPPIVAVFGEVVRLREQLRWFDTRPLFGLRVLVTRSRSQASALSERLSELGAEPIELPTIEFAPPDSYKALDAALRRLSEYDWLGFTSVNGVESTFGRLQSLGMDTRALAGVKVCAIGEATALALAARGIAADLVPPEYVSSSLVEALQSAGIAGKRVLLPRTDIAGEELVRGLESLAARVDQVIAYRTIAPAESASRARQLLAEGVDAVTFTSSSTVVNLLALLDGDPSRLGKAVVACIGPVTAKAARQAGLRVDIEAVEHTIPGLVQALVDYFAAKRGG
ncbi:MAG: uroporphyrinogen-III C-methyltransferase [Chloroflexota bacterium]|nr:uroporphyrinogen-III C-methyltransferase [Chloroflexota bacterium]